MHQVGFGWALLAIVAVQALTGAAMLGAGHRERTVRHVLPFLVSGAAGVLLATACLDLLPEAVRIAGQGVSVWEVLLGTLLALFCIQASAHWLSDQAAVGDAHGHTTNTPSPPDVGTRRRAGPGTLLLGSALHSMVDGVAITAAFAAGWRPGWSAAVAIALHELPHRLGDYALLLHLGVPKNRAAGAAIGAGAAALAGAASVAAFGYSAASAHLLLPVSAGSFLYIALVDLFPEMHATRRAGDIGWQLACLCAGALFMALVVHAGEGGS